MIVKVLLTKAQAQAIVACAWVGLELEEVDRLFNRAHAVLHALDQRVVRQPGDYAWLIARRRTADAIATRAEEMAGLHPDEYGGPEAVLAAVLVIRRAMKTSHAVV